MLCFICIVCYVSLSVLFVCKCVLYYCHRLATQLQSTNISHHIIPYLPSPACPSIASSTWHFPQPLHLTSNTVYRDVLLSSKNKQKFLLIKYYPFPKRKLFAQVPLVLTISLQMIIITFIPPDSRDMQKSAGRQAARDTDQR